MYSDDLAPSELPQAKQPRVIILPGERQDIFTTSGLQKAAKVYESGEEQEGKLTTDRSRRLLESAGVCTQLHVCLGLWEFVHVKSVCISVCIDVCVHVHYIRVRV